MPLIWAAGLNCCRIGLVVGHRHVCCDDCGEATIAVGVLMAVVAVEAGSGWRRIGVVGCTAIGRATAARVTAGRVPADEVADAAPVSYTHLTLPTKRIV